MEMMVAYHPNEATAHTAESPSHDRRISAARAVFVGERWVGCLSCASTATWR